MSKDYNPLDHSVVQAAVGAWSRYECDDFVAALFSEILNEIKRVHWNMFQHQWAPSWHGDSVEDPEIPGISFVRYYDDRCDCGGQSPKHAHDCEYDLGHEAWNDARLAWATVPQSEDERDEEIARGKRVFGEDSPLALFSASMRRLDPVRLMGEYPVPHPPCTCGGLDAFDEDRGCVDTCIGQRPNFQFEDVEIRWYKWPGRGMSTNKSWTSDEWRAWFDRCLANIRAFDRHDDYALVEKIRADFNARHPNAR